MDTTIPNLDAILNMTPGGVQPQTLQDTYKTPNLLPKKKKIPNLDLYVPKKAPNASGSLTFEDVANDQERMGKIRKMMAVSKDSRYETAPTEEVLSDFMTHMRWLNTNELSTSREAMNIYAADEDTRAIYGGAYQVYDEMGSMFSNGDAWNGVVDYGSAFVTSPSLWLGIGIGKVAGQAGTKAAAKAATKVAIDTATKQIVKKSGGKVAASVVKNELKNTAAKAAAKYHVMGALTTEAPMAAIQDYLLQDIRTDTNVQDEYSFLQGAISAVAGGLGAIPGIMVLRSSSKSPLAETGKLLDESYALRAKTAAKRAAPKIKASLEKAQVNWAKLVEAGKGMPENRPLEDAVFKWMFDVNDEDSLFRTIMSEGADLSFEENQFTKGIIEYAMGMGDEALKEFNSALKPLNLTFGEVTEMAAKVYSRAGQVFNPASQAKRFYNEFRNISVAKKKSAEQLLKATTEEAADADVNEKQLLGYAQSVWKKMLVSTFPTTAVNVKGWAIARSSTALADLTLAGGLLGRAGMRAIINPAGAMKDLSKVRALAANQTFALKTLVDPFLSAEAFLALLDKAPSKIKKSVSGQIFGGVDDFSPSRFGLDPNSAGVKTVEKISDTAQKISLVHVQDTLTKGVSGLTALDREARLAFNKGIQQLIVDGEAWKLTDEMWEKAMKNVLQETFSEDLSKGKHALRGIAKMIQDVSAQSGFGFLLPFGKFLNNTVAFTYRHSPLAYAGVGWRVWRGKEVEDIGSALARATVGTTALIALAAEQQQNQEEGLQWFERRNSDGSIEDITNIFPYSVYSLVGRIASNWWRGEGMDISLIDNLKQQIGPLEALESLTAPSIILDFARYITDPSIQEDEKAAFMDTVGSGLTYALGAVGEIAAGYTRPLDIYSRTLSYATPEAGGGLAVDRKRAEGMDKFTLGLTRYTSGFFNYLLGEENEYGVRMIGEPKESATSPGPAKIPNPAGTLTGTTLRPPTRNLDKILGMVDKPPFRADSFTSGVPEYDAYINKEVTPLLDLRAEELLESEMFKKAPQSKKIKMVDDMLRWAKNDLLSLLEGGRIGDPEDRLNNERRKLLVKDRAARRRAMKELGITTEEHKLSLFEIEAIQRRMDLEEGEMEYFK